MDYQHDTHGIVYASVDVMVRSVRSQYKKQNEPVKKFFTDNIPNSMISFGSAIHGGGDVTNITKSVDKLTKKYNYLRQFITNNMFIDSGGFQIQMEMVEPENIPYLIEGYCNLIDSIQQPNTYYYIEDVIPTITGKVNRQQAYDNTVLGMKEMSKLPESKRKNIYFVYHFQSPTVFDLWQDVMKATPPEEYLGGHRWAVGGIVSSGTVNDTNFISYMIPMLDILQREKVYLKQGNVMYFHILGVTGYLDILFYAIFEALLKKYNYNVHITFDSTSTIHSVCRANQMLFWDAQPNPGFYLADLTPSKAHESVKGFQNIEKYITNEQIIQEKSEYLKKTFNMTGIETHIADDGRMTVPAQYMFLVYHALSMQQMCTWCQEQAKQMIDVFYQDKREFGLMIVDAAKHLRLGKLTRDSNKKCTAIFNTIEEFDILLSHKGKKPYRSLDSIRQQINTQLQSYESQERSIESGW